MGCDDAGQWTHVIGLVIDLDEHYASEGTCLRGKSTQALRILVRMSRICLLLAFVSMAGCTNTDYRFEGIDGAQPTPLPFKLEGIQGVRDGAVVNAQARFSHGADVLTMNITLQLVPPPEFRSGRYEGTIGEKTIAGRVESTAVTFFGGQADQPSVGGVFILKDEQDRPVYRVRIPATPMTRRLGP